MLSAYSPCVLIDPTTRARVFITCGGEDWAVISKEAYH